MKKKKNRCSWPKLTNPQYVAYHDNEWGRPVHDDFQHFEMISLEGAQAGLSWETVLRKRDHYRKVFGFFDPQKVSKISKSRVDQILLDPGIIRNRLKVESTVSNALAFQKIQAEFKTFDFYIWNFVNQRVIFHDDDRFDLRMKVEISEKISKDLKKRGFRFVGSTIIYAYMQAAGLIQDHSKDCFLYGKKIRQLKL